MRYLIDGYNLLHAMGVLRGRSGPHVLEQARCALLGMLAGALSDAPLAVTVVFDAANPPRGAPDVGEYHGIQVHFAVSHEEADDLIELMIRRETAPRGLSVVSDDRRIQTAARRRRCAVRSCEEFLSDLEKQRRRVRPRRAPEPDKPAGSDAAQLQHWLGEFAALQHDPAWKALFDAYDFEREESQD